MAKARNPELERQWRERVAEFEASGLKVREFCLRHELSEQSFHQWRRELRRRDEAAASDSNGSPPTSRRAPKFVPVIVAPAPVVEVRCPSGHGVCLPMHDPATLRELFAALTVRGGDFPVLNLANAKIHLCLEPTDMRRGSGGLAAMAQEHLDGDPLSGTWFVFRSKRGDRLKILYWDRGGYAIWQKRLKRGVFEFPKPPGVYFRMLFVG